MIGLLALKSGDPSEYFYPDTIRGEREKPMPMRG
jgi:hypothetical protein